MSNNKSIPLPSLKRFSIYISVLCQNQEIKWVSTTLLSRDTGVKPITIRKDIAYLGIKGQPQKGYLRTELLDCLKDRLGGDNYKDVVLIGSWGLAHSYINYPELLPGDYKIRACFDYIEKEDRQRDIPIFPISRAAELIDRLGISIVMLSVEHSRLKEVLKLINSWNIKGVLNLSNVKIDNSTNNFELVEFNPIGSISELVAKIRS